MDWFTELPRELLYKATVGDPRTSSEGKFIEFAELFGAKSAKLIGTKASEHSKVGQIL